MPNLFDLLDQEDDEKVEEQQTSKRVSKRAQKKALKATQTKPQLSETSLESPMKQIYDLEDMWLLVLDFLPVRDIFLRINPLNKTEYERINQTQFFVKLLKRDCNGFFNLVESERKFKIIHSVDTENIFKSVSDSMGSFSVKEKSENLKVYKNCKTIFKSIYKQINNIQKEMEIQEENRMHHARIFLERELAKVKNKISIPKKQAECSHFSITRSDIVNDPKFKHVFSCKHCEIGMKTNFLPEGIYSKSKVTTTIEYDIGGKYIHYDYENAKYNFKPENGHHFEFIGL